MDDCICCLQDFLRGTVILFQFDNGCVGEILFKIQDISDVRPSPAVNGLIIIPYYAEIFIFICQHRYQFILAGVGILIFVHHDVTEAILIFFQHFGELTEQQNGFINQVIEVQSIVFLQHFLIGLVNLGNTHCLQVVFIHLLGIVFPADHFFLQAADDSHGPLNRKGFICRRHIQAFEGLTHDLFLIVPIVNGKLIFIIQMMDLSS